MQLHYLQNLSEAGSDHSHLANCNSEVHMMPPNFLNSFLFQDKIKLKQAEDEKRWKGTTPSLVQP